MQIIPIKTRVIHPPKDDIFEAFETSFKVLQEGDILLITSKVVAIHEGRCVPISDYDKEQLILDEAEYIYQTEYRSHPLTIKHHAFISSSGIDESNGSGYYILLPSNPYDHVRKIHEYIQKKFGITKIGVIMTDSHSLPLRYGAMSISIAHWGFVPVESHVGMEDLFHRPIQYSKTNIVDALAAAATLVSGECAEAQPLVIARDVPNIVFTNHDTRDALLIPHEEDIYRALYKDFHSPREERE